jgi:hypothetical protein
MTRLVVLAFLLVALTGCAGSGPNETWVPKCHEARASGVSLPEQFIAHDREADLEGPWPAFQRPCVPYPA